MVNIGVLSSSKKFFSEWKDDRKLNAAISVSCLFVALTLSWIATNMPELKPQADIYFMFVIIHMLLFAIDHIKEKNIIMGHMCMGRTLNHMLFGMAAGVGVGMLMLSNNFAVLQNPIAAIEVTSLLGGFIFVVVLAPFVEEILFRMAIYPSIINNMKGYLGMRYAGLLSIFLTSAMFAVFHYAAFGASVEAMTVAFAFSVIAIVGNRIMESGAFGIGMHYVINFFAFGGFPVLVQLGLM